MEKHKEIQRLVEALPPISLEEMSAVRLMNRTDQKFLTNTEVLGQLLRLTAGSYYSQENQGKRIAGYTTTYLDTVGEHEMYRTHHCGHLPRTKVRVRTYLDSGATFLEVKRKNNHGKTKKKRVAVASLDAVLSEHVEADFLQARSGYAYADLVPTLTNWFRRITLVNQAKTERLTIDFDLRFCNNETGCEAEMTDVVIIELKRDGRVASPVLPVLRSLRVKPSGFSKYCIGMAVTDDALRQNRFKKRMTRIRKVAGRMGTELPCLKRETNKTI